MASGSSSSRSLPPGITGVVLTKNGERLIDKCLSSLSFCDALLVVDSGSTDSTLETARRHGAEVLFHEWQGFDVQFTYAHSLVRTRWFFILDQDEICPIQLGRAITEAVRLTDGRAADSKATDNKMPGGEATDNKMPGGEATDNKTPDGKDAPVAFSVGRKSWYFDRFMRHSGWYPDPILRVFRTGCVEFYQDAHIHYRPKGRSEHIGGPGAEIVHYPYDSFEHQLSKLNLYAQQGADSLRARGRRGGVLPGLLHALSRFVRIYFFKRGFLDGKAGFLVACHGSFYAFLKYVRALDASWGEPFDDA